MKKNNKETYVKPLLPPVGIPLDMVDPVIPDPFGSYTGVPEDVLDKPVQDADDL
ncbi:MAG: hypothetical protein J6Q30_02885 [Oscillospiraceae bacterium]|nr:hypothetical protein [Oscillospiraceae bacterium]